MCDDPKTVHFRVGDPLKFPKITPISLDLSLLTLSTHLFGFTHLTLSLEFRSSLLISCLHINPLFYEQSLFDPHSKSLEMASAEGDSGDGPQGQVIVRLLNVMVMVIILVKYGSYVMHLTNYDLFWMSCLWYFTFNFDLMFFIGFLYILYALKENLIFIFKISGKIKKYLL